jgi:predicted negative regulator of RcsB-dependent stress response
MLADLRLDLGQPDQAEALLEQARTISRSTDQQMFAVEWHRLRGQVLQTRGRLDDAQAAYDDALEVARWQGARMLEPPARAALAALTATGRPL